MADVFVSYSRSDSELVNRLVERLRERGKDVWVDVEGIRDAEVFPAALRRAVEGSDGFVFVISPDSVASPFCEQEVDHAVELNKRIVPLAFRGVPDEQIPEGIRVRNWIPVGDGDFDGGRRSARAGARHRPRMGPRAHALAAEGDRVGRVRPRPQLPAARLGARRRGGLARVERGQGSRAHRAPAGVRLREPRRLHAEAAHARRREPRWSRPCRSPS